jgi:hypothetical protein
MTQWPGGSFFLSGQMYTIPHPDGDMIGCGHGGARKRQQRLVSSTAHTNVLSSNVHPKISLADRRGGTSSGYPDRLSTRSGSGNPWPLSLRSIGLGRYTDHWYPLGDSGVRCMTGTSDAFAVPRCFRGTLRELCIDAFGGLRDRLHGHHIVPYGFHRLGMWSERMRY